MIAASARVMLAACLVAALAACSSAAGATSNQATNYVSVNGTGVVTQYPVGHRAVAPAVTGTDLTGQPLTLASYAGKVIVLNFWASWCPPCRSEAPALEQVATDTHASGVQFVGVDIRETGVADAVRFDTTHGVDYPSFYDQSDRIALAFRGKGVPETPPTTLVIDRTGHIAARGLGEMTYDQLLQVVQSVAKEPS
jgi:thiol-disulfide isomerase/thioredoxin